MTRIRTLVVDDEELGRLRLLDLLGREPDVEVVGACRSGEEAVEALHALRPDLALLDVEMHGLSGLDVAARAGVPGTTVFIFVTGHDAYALRAFEVHALDYVLKPFSDGRFHEALDRARARLGERASHAYHKRLEAVARDYALSGDGARADRAPEALVRPHPAPAPAAYANRIVVRSGARKIFVKTDDVDYIEAEGVYVRLHAAGKHYLLRDALNNVEERLDPDRFVRIHRSMIVNVDRIREIAPHFNGGGVVTLVDGRTLKLSRSYRDRVRVTIG